MASIYPDRTLLDDNELVIWQTDLTGTLDWTTDGVDAFTGPAYTTQISVVGIHRIEVTNGTSTISRDIEVVSDTFALSPSLPIGVIEGSGGQFHVMRDGRRRGLMVSAQRGSYDLPFRNKSFADWSYTKAFWRSHDTIVPFVMADPFNPAINIQVYFDSEPKLEYGGHGCSYSFSFKVKEG